MAGDWIKMRADLHTHPKVVRISSALKADRLRVVGGLHAVWCLFDAHSEDGSLSGYTTDAVDELIGFPGFANALCSVKWLISEADGIVLPEFDEHNGQSAKRRASETKRKRLEREQDDANDDRNLSASDADEKRSREEKRREDTSSLRSEVKPRKARVSPKLKITLTEYLEICKAEDRKPVPADHPIRTYCEDAGITEEMRQVAWLVFKDRHVVVAGSKVAPKKYIDWAAAFANSVKDRWYGLWYVGEEGEATWSPDGLQQRRVLDSRMAKNREAEHAPA